MFKFNIWYFNSTRKYYIMFIDMINNDYYAFRYRSGKLDLKDGFVGPEAPDIFQVNYIIKDPP